MRTPTTRRTTPFLCAWLLMALACVSLSFAQEPPVRIETAGRADVPTGATTLVARDVSQWVCLQRMPSATVVPISAAMSDRAEATGAPVLEDVTTWFSLEEAAGSADLEVALVRVEQIWDVTPTVGGGVAFRVFCRVVLGVTPRSGQDTTEADEEITLDVRLGNLGGHTFGLRYPLRTVSR